MKTSNHTSTLTWMSILAQDKIIRDAFFNFQAKISYFTSNFETSQVFYSFERIIP